MCLTATKLALDPFIETNSPFLLFIGAVMTAAWYGGLGPGLVTTLLAALASLFMSPRFSLSPGNPGDAINLSLFLIEGSLISLLAAQAGSARRKAGRVAVRPPDRSAERGKPDPDAELEVLNRLALTLAGQLDMARLVQAVTDAGVAITGAAFGAFLYRDASGRWGHFVSGKKGYEKITTNAV